METNSSRTALADQHQAELDRIIEIAIDRELINDSLRERLHAACRRTGADYNDVIEHIGAEIAANR